MAIKSAKEASKVICLKHSNPSTSLKLQSVNYQPCSYGLFAGVLTHMYSLAEPSYLLHLGF